MRAVCLVSDADKVVGELLDGVGGRSRLDALGVVSDEDGEGGLDDDDTLLALNRKYRPSAINFQNLQHYSPQGFSICSSSQCC